MDEPIEAIDSNTNLDGISEKNLIYTIWLKPKKTLEYILKYCPNKYVTLFFVLGGIGKAIDKAISKGMGDNQSTMSVLTFAIIGGALFGWISYYFYAWLLKVTGKWIKGTAEAVEFRTILAWALVPQLLSLILVIPQLLLLGDDLFRSEIEDSSIYIPILFIVFGLLDITLGIWSMVIMIKGISLIQNFGTWKAILNAIMPGFLILIPILFLVMLLQLFN